MKYIESRHNPLYKEWIRNRRLAGRQGHPVWLEGPHLCESWLINEHPLQWLIVDEARRDLPEINSLIQMVQIRGQSDQILALNTQLFKNLSDVPSQQGVLLIAPKLQQALPQSLTQSVVVLDGVQDPGNVGVILRISAAVGVGTIITQSGTAACWSPKVLRSAQGAHSGLQIVEDVDVVVWLSDYRREANRLPILVTTLEEASDLYATKLPDQGIWVFGHEGQGVSPELTALADLRIRIDHSTQYVESLNVGVAAALCLFEQQRQGRHS
ncbi:TrmH family RNA methyltransferase [Orrella sp. 11846]|uniref:TrmH family RNA methyltransferase n=1 Tax=Orrella sp. 11846 TaxID=3409913 RepID=UPI003B5B412F